MTVPAVPLSALTDAELVAIAANPVRFNPQIRIWAREQLARRGVDAG